MTNQKLLLDVKPNQLVAYDNLRVAFYDKKYKTKRTENEDGEESFGGEEIRLYIHIENSNDPYAINKRQAKKRRVMKEDGEFTTVHETKLFERAYKKYLELKSSAEAEPDYKSQLEAAQKQIAELQASASDISSKENEPLVKKGRPKKEEVAE